MKSNKILIDIDNKAKFDEFTERFKSVIDMLHMNIINIIVQETHKGFHVYIFLEFPIPVEEVLYYQLILGSDYKREAMNWNRNKIGLDVDFWNVLFKQKHIVLAGGGKSTVISAEKADKEKSGELMNLVSLNLKEREKRYGKHMGRI